MATEEGTTIGKTITLLIIFLVTIVVIVVIFGYFNGLFKFATAGHGSMMAAGVFALPGRGGSTGSIIVQVTDTSQVSLTGISFVCPAVQFTSSDCGGLHVSLNGTAISPENPLNDGQTATGSASVQSAPEVTFMPGSAYLVIVNVMFSDGSTLSQTLTLPAQAG